LQESKRCAGVLLHPTSLPGHGPCGTLGAEAYHFIDFLKDGGITLWQTLPMGPTHEDGSPYQCLSVHAGNERLIDLDLLVEHGWLLEEQRQEKQPLPYETYCQACLYDAYHGFVTRASEQSRLAFDRFVEQHEHWLDDYALYRALREAYDMCSWTGFPKPLRDREPAAMEEARQRLAGKVQQVKFEQFLFFQQWLAIKNYANERDVQLFGDMPIFVAHDSAEVWAHREYFYLDDEGQPLAVAGVPPDYFSATGQRWGNPLYRWDVMAKDKFHWWKQRLHTQLEQFDVIRIDHFRGFEAYWEIPASAGTAIDGHWVKGPGGALFEELKREFGSLPLIAEDLGLITEEVHALRDEFGLPGMKILQFAFDGGPQNSYLPHNHVECCVVYTGTHDNDTSLGWFNALSTEQQQHVLDYLGHSNQAMPWPLVRAALGSVAKWAIIPMQDLLGLDGTHRMNTPGTSGGNWHWRFHWDQVPEYLPQQLRHLIHLFGR